jgi:hypothetical protein
MGNEKKILETPRNDTLLTWEDMKMESEVTYTGEFGTCAEEWFIPPLFPSYMYIVKGFSLVSKEELHELNGMAAGATPVHVETILSKAMELYERICTRVGRPIVAVATTDECIQEITNILEKERLI